LEQIQSVVKRRAKPGTSRLTRNSKIFKTIIKAIQEKKGENIISLDLRKIPEAVSDFFVICEADNPVQIKAITDNIEDKVKEETGESPHHREGVHGANWSLLDYINIVVHVMHPDTRKFYKLEEMWNDAGGESHS
jgi:ribosome-associated protein